MALLAIAAGVMLAAAPPSETVTVEGTRPAVSQDICLQIAQAKVKQWAEARIARERTDTFAGGATRVSRFIFTPNMLYAEHSGIWEAMQVSWAQRRGDVADAVARRMDLADCSKGAATIEAGVTTYTYSMGKDAVGQLDVSDATGLPLRMRIAARDAKPGAPVSISLRYGYGDGVQVPRGAELAAFQHRTRAQQWLLALQEHRAAW
jgi:hypothetical protein